MVGLKGIVIVNWRRGGSGSDGWETREAEGFWGG